MSLSGAVFVNRKNSKDAVKAMNAAGEDMKRQGVSTRALHKGEKRLTDASARAARAGLAMDLPRGYALEQARAGVVAVQKGRVSSRRARCVSSLANPLFVRADLRGSVANVPIIPVVCESYHRLFDGKTRMERGVLKVKGGSLSLC